MTEEHPAIGLDEVGGHRGNRAQMRLHGGKVGVLGDGRRGGDEHDRRDETGKISHTHPFPPRR